MKAFVTGGAGFIGSHLVEELAKNSEVVVYDNLSEGRMENIKEALKNHGKVNFVKGDILDFEELKNAMDGCNVVYHLAANPNVQLGESNDKIHFEQNIIGTKNVLDAAVHCNIWSIVFSSSSTVYGAAPTPTKESFGPCTPISMYGASKLAGEAMICAYASKYKLNATILRFANIIGKRSNHGIIFDFIKKLTKNPEELKIFGDGTQRKSYLHVSDCINGIITAQKINDGISIVNLGSEDTIDVNGIAEIITKKMKLCPKMIFSGGEAWKGDIKTMQLDITKMKGLGWQPKFNSKEAIEKTMNEMIGVQ